MDLGGGTFDISLVKSVGEELDAFSVVASLGERELGGDDFTNLLVDHIKTSIKNLNDKIDFNSQVTSLIREEANKAKHIISETASVNINFPFLPTKEQGTFPFSMDLSSADFDKICEPLIQKIKEKIQEFLELDKVKDQKITKIVLVGGASRMKLFKELPQKMFKIKPNIDINPDEVVANGAAYYAYFASTPDSEKLVIDVNPLSLGTEICIDEFVDDHDQYLYDEIIPANTPLPTRKTKNYTTVYDNQEAIGIQILQGGRKIAKDNIELGYCVLAGIKIAKAHTPQINVSFELDEDGILDVTAVGEDTKSTVNVQIKNTLNLTEDVIERLKNIALKMSDIDQNRIDFYSDLRVLKNWKKFFDVIEKPIKLSDEDNDFVRSLDEFILNPDEKTNIKSLITRLRIIIQEQDLEDIDQK